MELLSRRMEKNGRKKEREEREGRRRMANRRNNILHVTDRKK